MRNATFALLLLSCTAYATDPMTWQIEGFRLSATEVAPLEANLASDPSNLEARIKLLGWLGTNAHTSTHLRDSQTAHILWLIEHQPGLDKLIWSSYAYAIPTSQDGSRSATRAATLWKAHLAAAPGNTQYIAGAAAQLAMIDKAFSSGLLERGMKLTPTDPDWARQLGQRGLLDARSTQPDVQYTNASRALRYFEQAIAVASDEDYLCGLIYDSAAQAAWLVDRNDKAAKWAQTLVKRARAGAWWFNNALHHGHTMLGLIALDQGRVAEAKKELALSADVGTSPQLGSFGPSLTLAAALLARGERDAVVEFLEAAPVFLTMNEDRFKDAVTTIKGGGTPTEFRTVLRKIPQKKKKT